MTGLSAKVALLLRKKHRQTTPSLASTPPFLLAQFCFSQTINHKKPESNSQPTIPQAPYSLSPHPHLKLENPIVAHFRKSRGRVFVRYCHAISASSHLLVLCRNFSSNVNKLDWPLCLALVKKMLLRIIQVQSFIRRKGGASFLFSI